ncbi:fimbrial protein [Pantoea sp. NSTU24]|uniref:fimbrial protein n=1 Tax=Pantoea sp. NSTU24 TaxID=3391144 RepID=UPI003CFE713E
MKKIKLAMIMGMALASSTVFAADQGHGVVNFKGEIIEAPCSISADSVEQTIDLGQVTSSTLKGGKSSSPVAFSIKLQDCDVTSLAKKTVTATFTGKAASFDSTSSLLALSGTASGAGIAITDDGKKPVKLGTASTPFTLNDTSTTATLQYAAFLQGATDNTQNPVIAGQFTSIANFTLAYE